MPSSLPWSREAAARSPQASHFSSLCFEKKRTILSLSFLPIPRERAERFVNSASQAHFESMNFCAGWYRRIFRFVTLNERVNPSVSKEEEPNAQRSSPGWHA